MSSIAPSRPTSPRPSLHSLMLSSPQKRESTRSEQLLREMLSKDGVARSRSGSRSSIAVAGLPLAQSTIGGSVRSRHGRNESISDVASIRDESEVIVYTSTAAMHMGTGIGAVPSAACRPRPLPRNTHDGVIPNSNNPLEHLYNPCSPSDGSSHSDPNHVHLANAPNDMSSRAAPQRHTSTPLFSTSKHEDYDEALSPSPTSMNSSGWNSPRHQHRTPSPSSSHSPHSPPLCTRNNSTASASFNLEQATEYCKSQSGYVSFGDIEGLGRPAGEEEEERKERERLEREGKKWNWLGWNKGKEED